MYPVLHIHPNALDSRFENLPSPRSKDRATVRVVVASCVRHLLAGSRALRGSFDDPTLSPSEWKRVSNSLLHAGMRMEAVTLRNSGNSDELIRAEPEAFAEM